MPKLVDRTKEAAKEVRNSIKEPVESPKIAPYEGNFGLMTSTGSTLLNLSISGGRVRGGGIPGGILLEIYGPSGKGKTALLSEILASVQANGGEASILDPEGRIDKEYARIYGVELDKKNYKMPDTVTEVFEHINTWKPKPEGAVHAIGTDSLAALSTELELSTKGDSRGQRRAKEFSEGFRKTCRIIKKNNWLIPCTNQVRQSDYGEITPGGKAVEFYSSLRIRVSSPPYQGSLQPFITTTSKYIIDKDTKIDVSETSGIRSLCTVTKSSVDNPFREAPVYIVFGYGIDDISANLQYVKNMTKATRYDCITKEYQSIEKAFHWIEEHDLEDELREKVIDIWERVREVLKVDRKPKKR